MSPFLVDAARPLLIVHALAAIVTLGSSAHLGVLGALLLRRGRAPTRLIRVHVRVLAVAYAVTFTLGCILYPTFRVLVRGLILDRDAPWASNAFDMKEALVLVGLPVVAALWFLGRRFELPRDEAARTIIGALGVAISALVLAGVIIALVVTSVQGPT